jgi:hypothetical protein
MVDIVVSSEGCTAITFIVLVLRDIVFIYAEIHKSW